MYILIKQNLLHVCITSKVYILYAYVLRETGASNVA